MESESSNPEFNTPLPREFYDRDVRTVARDLLGRHLVRSTQVGLTAGRIVEVEAYLAQGDSACHGHRGQTPRNTSMFGPSGFAYVYAIHARWCFNVVTQPTGQPSAVLVRALEPDLGIPLMRQRRGDVPHRLLTAGPARLCAALDIDRALDGHDLTTPRDLWISADELRLPSENAVVTTTRIGVTSAKGLRLRYVVADSPCLSRPVRQGGRSRRRSSSSD